jgi:hypothetical protein
VWRTLLVKPSPSAEGRDDITLVLPQAKGEWVFIRLIDAASGKLRARATLRTPAAIEPVAAHLCGSRLFLVGQRAALLEVDVDTFHVQRFCANVLRSGEGVNRLLSASADWDPRFPEAIIEEAVITPDGRTLILNMLSGPHQAAKRSLQVIELEQLRPIRELNEPPHRARRDAASRCAQRRERRVPPPEDLPPDDPYATVRVLEAHGGAPRRDDSPPQDDPPGDRKGDPPPGRRCAEARHPRP